MLTDDDESETKGGRNPMGVLRASCPRVDEETGGYERGGKNTRNEIVLDLAESARGQRREDAVFEEEKLSYKGDEARGDNSEEYQACRCRTKAEVVGVDNGERLY